MRTISLFIALATVLVMSACGGSKFKSAVEYNDFIIGQQELILEKHKATTDALDADNIQEAKTQLAALSAQCKASVDTLNTMEAYNNNTEFRDAAVKLFTYYGDFADKGFKEELDILSKPDFRPEDRDRINQIEDEFSSKEGDLYSAFIDAQNKFAADNNMTLVNK